MDITALSLLLLDSRAPAGGHNHSAGMEAAVGCGYVHDTASVEAFGRARLYSSGVVAAGFAARSAAAFLAGVPSSWWAACDLEFDARTPSAAARSASRQLGRGLRRLLRSLGPLDDLDALFTDCPPPSAHHPLVLGAGVALTGGSVELAARAALLSTVSVPASAAVRLLGLDPFAVQSVLARLAADIDLLAANAAMWAGRSPAELPCLAAPALDLLPDVHHTAEVKLFAS